MKKITNIAIQMAIITSAATITACGSDNNKTDKNSSANATEKKDTKSQGNDLNSPIVVRYVDEEELLKDYNLAKDFQDAIQRAQSKLMSAQQSRASEIQQLGSQIETKMKSNGYSTEAEYNADMARFQKKQQDAESYLGNLQRSTELEISQLQTQLQDSIKAYVQEFSEKKGYDAVVLQSAGLYFNPKMNVTKEIVEGLNARYNKVKEK